ncbi:tyrosine-type recombinase/integrase [Cytobacillus firmus]|uniref:tyrosine-type recombinase/integrase n=1 Tax=Cytobacillus firmus TaxID=1399 RepID=UPI0018CFE6F7|nr:site-specific integrase [Cytobacillus firmus]MBG9654900.1 integrase [Cytobacillus firmus]MED1907121.1 site-specific integrase [Cytobacillus firmus]
MNQYDEKIDLYFELHDTPESSRESYGRRMRSFISYMNDRNLSIEMTTEENIQDYILYLKKVRGLSAGTINNYISSVRFFYTYVLEKEWNPRKVPRMKRPHAFPVIPSRNDVLNLMNTIENRKHKAIFSLMYGSGLRVSEVARLKIGDICSKTMRIRVANAKHNTNRYTILSEASLLLLRDYFRSEFAGMDYSPGDWLFSGTTRTHHIHVKTIKNTMIKHRNRLGMDTKVSAHTLRHCFATHALEDGVDPVFIQQMLGHKRLQTSLSYLHMTSKSLMGVKSPLDSGRDRPS